MICHGIRLLLAVDVQGLHQLFSLLETGTLKLPNEAWRRLAGTERWRMSTEGGSWRMEGRCWAARMDDRLLPSSQVAKWLCFPSTLGNYNTCPLKTSPLLKPSLSLSRNIFTGFLYPSVSLPFSDASPLASSRGSEACFLFKLTPVL